VVYFDSVQSLNLANVEKQFAIASPKFFEIYETNWKAATGNGTTVTIPILATIGEQGWFVLTVGSKDYLTVAMRLIPSGSYIYGFGTNATAAVGYGWPSFYDRYPLWVHEEEVDPVTKQRRKTGNKLPIVLPPEQKYLVTLNFDSLSGLSSFEVDVMVVLWGTLFREVQ